MQSYDCGHEDCGQVNGGVSSSPPPLSKTEELLNFGE